TQCWLWTGSHNLTASASQGVNCEAAVVLEGSIEEQPFRDAMSHLERCKQESRSIRSVPSPAATAAAADAYYSRRVPGCVEDTFLVRSSTARYDGLRSRHASTCVCLALPSFARHPTEGASSPRTICSVFGNTHGSELHRV